MPLRARRRSRRPWIDRVYALLAPDAELQSPHFACRLDAGGPPPCPLCAGEGRRAWARPFLEQLCGRMVQIEEAVEAMRATVIPAAVAAVADEEEARDAAGA